MERSACRVSAARWEQLPGEHGLCHKGSSVQIKPVVRIVLIAFNFATVSLATVAGKSVRGFHGFGSCILRVCGNFRISSPVPRNTSAFRRR